jgi:2-hydroxy-3-keto-5-methylthiopentenyl-1-phosphate phosphatase
MNIEVFCDFDGTVTVADTIDLLLEELGDPAWKAHEERWVRGEIGSRECMALQVPLIAVGAKNKWQAIFEVLDGVAVDPTFKPFVAWLKEKNIPLRIVSDGMDRVIQYFFQREDIQVDGIWANSVSEDGEGLLKLGFPHSVAGCGSGVCKCRVLDSGNTKAKRVVIGDGRSDFCWSQEADIVYAKGSLLRELTKIQHTCVPFENFDTIRASLESLMDRRSKSDAKEPVVAPGATVLAGEPAA